MQNVIPSKIPFYKLELKICKNYHDFLSFIEEEIKKDSFCGFKIKKREETVYFSYTTQGSMFFRPKFEVRIKIKKTDDINFHLTMKGKYTSYGYQTPERYINKLLLKILSSRF